MNGDAFRLLLKTRFPIYRNSEYIFYNNLKELTESSKPVFFKRIVNMTNPCSHIGNHLAFLLNTEWTRLPYEVLEKASSRITNEIKGITRVVYDITSKPPATVEWE